MELANAVVLTSADTGVSRLAAHSLRAIALTEKRLGIQLNEALSEEDRARRFTIYDQIGDPKAVITGRVAWQKRLRRLFRTLSVPIPNHVAIWEECYYRWCALTELVIRAPMDPITSDAHVGGPVPTGDRSLSFEVS